MVVKQVKITKAEGEGRLLGYAIVDTDTMRIWDIKIVKKGEEKIISLPSKRKEKGGVVSFHPYMKFNQVEWDTIREAVLAEYDKEI